MFFTYELYIYVILFEYEQYISVICFVYTILLFDSACPLQGHARAPSLDVMMLKQQFFTTSGVNQGHDRSFQYAYRRYHPLLQFLPLKLAEWVAKNMSDELNLPDLPDSDDDLNSAVLNSILTQCMVSNRSGNNLHTYQCVEFESDLYRGVMRARCYPFNMDNHWFLDKNVKVCPYNQLRYEYVIIYHIYYLDTNEIFYSYDMILYTYECSMTGLRCNYSPLSPLHWRTR